MTGRLALVTGATGFLGSALTAGLLAGGYAVRCVVRGTPDAEPGVRLRTALEPVADVPWHRVETVEGDLSREQLGLPPERFAALAAGVGLVVHCGAHVNLRRPYEVLHDTNVRGTAELLRAAEAASAPFAYIGSLAAVGAGTVGEPFELTEPVSGGYGESKWTADRLVSAAHTAGRVPAAIFRAGRVTADSRTGRANPADLLERVIRCCVRIGAFPEIDTRIRLSPLDWVSTLIVRLSGTPAAFGRAYHLATEQVLPWSAVGDTLGSAGYALATVPYHEWRGLVLAAGRDAPELARLARALPAEGMSFDKRPVPGPANARAVLGDRFPELPPAARLLMDTVAAWQRAGLLPAVGRAEADLSGGGGDPCAQPR